MIFRLTPLPSRSSNKATNDGSTPSDNHPVSALYPMWAMCLEEPDWGLAGYSAAAAVGCEGTVSGTVRGNLGRGGDTGWARWGTELEGAECPWEGGNGGGFFLCFGASWASRTNDLIYSISRWMIFRLTPLPSRSSNKATNDGSTPSDNHPVSASYPAWAMCLKEPNCGLEIIDLSILSLLSALFIFLTRVVVVHEIGWTDGMNFWDAFLTCSEIFFSFFRIYFSEKLFGFWFFSVDKTNHAFPCAKRKKRSMWWSVPWFRRTTTIKTHISRERMIYLDKASNHYKSSCTHAPRAIDLFSDSPLWITVR